MTDLCITVPAIANGHVPRSAAATHNNKDTIRNTRPNSTHIQKVAQADKLIVQNEPPASVRAPIASSPKKPQQCPQKIQFILDGKEYTDILYSESLENTGCSSDKCLGSLLSVPPTRPPGTPRDAHQVLVQAQDFINQYFKSIKRLHTPAHDKRWQEVRAAIETRGTYDLTTAELTYGAKTAWRNAPRCIGRIQWSKLQVFDARHIRSARGMYEALCNHIKYGTNRGNIRSAITIFPPRSDNMHDFRVWNSQLIGYAGYKQPNGTVIGDKARVEFTEVCRRMGWRGAGGRWDVLPLVLQADGMRPELFDIPKDLVLEVTLKHPDHAWFESLGLRWYALPAVANMMLDCGGMEFTAVPFNGWYMGTEIGARDLCDPNRYDITKEVALKFGLDTRNPATLWKDRVLVEVNTAVLYSYQKLCVTMVDHHTAAESFMKHFENEHKTRGGCPADWVWIVPPMSGSLCPVFHQEMLNYKLKPSYEYLPEPWKNHVWADNLESEDSTEPRVYKKRRFKDVARAVMFSAKMMRSAMTKRIKCTILYATETGRSQSYANTVCEMFKMAFDARVLPMEEYDLIELEHEALVLVVTSTFGNGDPPDKGKDFAEQLYQLMDTQPSNKRQGRRMSLIQQLAGDVKDPGTSAPQPRRRPTLMTQQTMDVNTEPLSNVRFSVFALGSTAYPNYCAFGRFVDRIVGELGGERLHVLGEGDELCGQEEAFSVWSNAVFKAACEAFCIDDQVNLDAASVKFRKADQTWTPGKFRLTTLPDTPELDLCSGLSTLHNKQIKSSNVLQVSQLQAPTSTRHTVNVRLDAEEQPELMHQPGDHVAVYPANNARSVDAIIARLVNPPPDDTVFKIEMNEDAQNNPFGSKSWGPYRRMPFAVSLRTALTRYLDITTPPKPTLLEVLALLAADDADKDNLLSLAQDHQKYDEWRYSRYPELADVLAAHPSIKLAPTLLLSQLPLLQPRYYSLSSAPTRHPGELQLTVAVVQYETDDGRGPLHRGVCSNWLQGLSPGHRVPCIIRSAKEFRLPEDSAAHVIMIGPGTGIAPLRSFWQHRQADMQRHPQQQFGEMILYCGARRSDVDDIYRQEKAKALETGALTQLHTALSREPGVAKTYVQDLLNTNSVDVFDQIINKHAHVYVCGDVSMANDVKHTLEAILRREGTLSEDDAKNYVMHMRENLRFHEDIFGVTLRTSKVHDKARKKAVEKSLLGALFTSKFFWKASSSSISSLFSSRDKTE